MNLRKRQIFEVNHTNEKIKDSHCLEKDTKRRKKKKPVDGVGVLIHRIHASNDEVYEAAEDLVTSRRKYFEVKSKVRCILAEKEELREDLCQKKNNLQRITSELRQAVADLKTVDMNKLSEEEATIVSLNSWLVEEDVIEAWKHISYADNDLNEEDNWNISSTNTNSNTKNDVRTLNSVSVPNVISSDTVLMNGSININRNKCCICLDQRINAVLYKCGHMCMCFKCASELINMSQEKKCPVCRTEVVDVIKTYLA